MVPEEFSQIQFYEGNAKGSIDISGAKIENLPFKNEQLITIKRKAVIYFDLLFLLKNVLKYERQKNHEKKKFFFP